jgi:hypothetical protein
MSGLTDFLLNPPLRLARTPLVLVRTLDEAAEFVRAYDIPKRALQRDGVLRRLEAAGDVQAKQEAANAFRAWVEEEGLLIEAVEPSL